MTAKVVEPTEDEVKAFYNDRKERFGKDFKEVKAEIIAYLKVEREKTESLSFRHSSCLSSQAINSFTTRPAVSVSRKLRPLYLKVSLSWFRPIK